MANVAGLDPLITVDELLKQLEARPSILSLGKVHYVVDLLALVEQLNLQLRESGQPCWRLPTQKELLDSYKLKDGRFGVWFTWSGDVDHTNSACLMIVKMSNGESLGDDCGSAVEAYLIPKLSE